MLLNYVCKHFYGGIDMAIDHAFFEEMEARIPKGTVRTRFAPFCSLAQRSICI